MDGVLKEAALKGLVKGIKHVTDPKVRYVGRRGMAKAVNKQFWAGHIGRMVEKSMKKRGLKGRLELFGTRRKVKQAARKFANRGLLGTIVKRGKGRGIYLNRRIKGHSMERSIKEHERFHLLPVVGQSEILAHLYGAGAAAVTGSKEGVIGGLLGLASRPGRLALEGGVGYGGYGAYKKLKEGR